MGDPQTSERGLWSVENVAKCSVCYVSKKCSNSSHCKCYLEKQWFALCGMHTLWKCNVCIHSFKKHMDKQHVLWLQRQQKARTLDGALQFSLAGSYHTCWMTLECIDTIERLNIWGFDHCFLAISTVVFNHVDYQWMSWHISLCCGFLYCRKGLSKKHRESSTIANMENKWIFCCSHSCQQGLLFTSGIAKNNEE